VTQTGDHHAYADQHEADEDVELAAVEQRRHDRDSQDTGVRVVAPADTTKETVRSASGVYDRVSNVATGTTHSHKPARHIKPAKDKAHAAQ
jgi:hypothetical protein